MSEMNPVNTPKLCCLRSFEQHLLATATCPEWSLSSSLPNQNFVCIYNGAMRARYFLI
jgi:hypothetical protein